MTAYTHSCGWESLPWPLFPPPFWKGLVSLSPSQEKEFGPGNGIIHTTSCLPHSLVHAFYIDTHCKVTQQLALIFQITAQCDTQGHIVWMKTKQSRAAPL